MRVFKQRATRVAAGLARVGAIAALLGLSAPGVASAQDGEGVTRVVPESYEQVRLSFAPLVKRVAPAVVNIYTRRVVQVRSSPLLSDPFFQRFFGDNFSFGMPRERVQGSLGSGVIVRETGVIVTNNHVIGRADSITVVLADRREFEAEVVLADERTDLAILQIDTAGETLPTLNLADSDDIEVGDLVLAIGNPFGVGQTVTSGIVSAVARTQVGISDLGFFIQTDAAVNPGNSGGALVGADGSLLGINTAIYSRSGGNNGIGFAVPANMVQSVITGALSDGVIMRPWIGVAGQTVDSDLAASLGLDRPGGVLVDDVYAGGPAGRAGIRPGDVILDVDGREVVDERGLRFRVATLADGARVDVGVLRAGGRESVPVALALPPEDPPRDLRVLDGRHPFQGVKVGNLSPRFADELGIDPLSSGVIVLELQRGSPAARRQFVRPGDIVLALNDERVTTAEQLDGLLTEPQQQYVYRLNRRGRTIECGILGSRSFYCR